MKLTTLLCCFLLFTCSTYAQDAVRDWGRPPLVPGITELKIGDQVPDIIIDKIINSDKRSIRISDYKDKLLVLDFWDTSCTVCIASMPKLDSLQRVFGDQIKLLSVTYQPEDIITKFFKNSRYLNERNPPVHRASVVDDRILRSYFRYETNPHVVWINKGKVVAITGGEYITSENIQTILNGKRVNWLLKTDHFDSSIPFVTLSPLWQYASDSPYYSYSILTGQAASVPAEGGIHFNQDTISNNTRLAILNQDIYTTYQMLLHNTKVYHEEDATKGLMYLPHPSRIILEVADPTRFLYKKEYGEYADWNKKNLICYELVKNGLEDKAMMAKLAIQDLNNRLGLNGRYERRKVKCLVFVNTDKPISDTLALDKGGEPMWTLVMMHLDMNKKFPPAINETGFVGGLNMQPYDGTILGLRKEMQRHGLDLIEAEREIEVIVISESK
ncbi:TlpA family protein disulfide reductase [Sphingobacterium sp. UBA6320]|uniref:TlpA family protein disulfide reductase n=1 Tax=Sphingobacterium sp. UBA6320 TaxID=1947510 RepID=UPI0025D971C4|nr:redoxin domain-containing protein [Sphingobacterium sp. UBA6320]